MAKPKPSVSIKPAPLAAGQIWRVDGMNLQVNRIGPLMVQYKVSKPDALKGSNEIQARTAVEKYLKKNKAVLLSPSK